MKNTNALDLIKEVLNVWTVQAVSDQTGISKDSLQRFRKCAKDVELESLITVSELKALEGMLPTYDTSDRWFRFVDLFAGIGGIRKGFDDIGGECVLTAEWNDYAVRTYKANFGSGPNHQFVQDIKTVTTPEGLKEFPDHDVLLAGFPCQPFSLAGVSKKNSLGRVHGFECEDQGQLFFDVVRILKEKKPSVFVLENVKNLKGHDKGNTFKVIKQELVDSGYWVANLNDDKPDPKIIDGANFTPQHRERIVLVGFRNDLVNDHAIDEEFDLRHISQFYPQKRASLVDILNTNKQVDDKYTLTPKLWEYLVNYAEKHRQKGNGFGYGMVRRNKTDVARTLSARYHKDGSEILINQDDLVDHPEKQGRPRRLTPQECARLMGFCDKNSEFKIPVSDTRAYQQFGNSVVVPVFSAVAKLIEPYLKQIISSKNSKDQKVA